MNSDSDFDQRVEKAVVEFEIWCEDNGSKDLELYLEETGLSPSVADEVRKYFEQEKQFMEVVAADTPGAHGLSATNSMGTTNLEDNCLRESIGRYRVKRVLGKGGFGIVYLAYDTRLERLVAIKVPHARFLAQPRHVEAYLAEARTVANLDHPHIVPVYDAGQTDDIPCFIVSKYVKGTDLATRLKQTQFSVAESAELIATVADALHYAHRNGLVHRDVKPGNILIGEDGQIQIVDFGLALKDQGADTIANQAGTPAYMSPEQARGEGHLVDGRSDIYSLGGILYELLVGRRTFQAKSRSNLLAKISTVEVKPPRQIDDSIPRELERICLRSLAKRATDRYTTACDMAADLRHFLTDRPSHLIPGIEK